MYFIFRCDCGRVLYSKEGVATRKCVCGKSLKVKERRIFKKSRISRRSFTNSPKKCKKKFMELVYLKKANEIPKKRF